MEAIHLVRTNTTAFRSSKSDFSLNSLLPTPTVPYKILQPITVGDLYSKSNPENVRNCFLREVEMLILKALKNIKFYFRCRKMSAKIYFLLFHML